MSEPFFRIGKKGVVELLKIEGNTESIYNVGLGDGDFPRGMNDDNKSQFTSITNQTGVSIRTSKTMATQYFEISPNTEFLLLDLRNEDEYQNYRIREGETAFPA